MTPLCEMPESVTLQSQVSVTPRRQILRGESPRHAIAADFVDADTPTAKLCDGRVLEPGDVDYVRDQAA